MALLIGQAAMPRGRAGVAVRRTRGSPRPPGARSEEERRQGGAAREVETMSGRGSPVARRGCAKGGAARKARHARFRRGEVETRGAQEERLR